MTPEQQRALALARAKLKLQAQAPAAVQADVRKAEPPEPPAEPPPAILPPKEGELFGRPSFDPTSPEMVAANPVTRAARGVADPIVGLFQLGANTVGLGKGVNKHLESVENMSERGRAQMGSEGMDLPRLAGNVASPVWRAATALIKPAVSLPGRMMQTAGFGAAGGATAPVDKGQDFWGEKAVQTGGGAAVGGIFPAASAAVSKVANMGYHGLIEPWLKPAAIKGRAYLEAAGDKTQEIIDLLTKNKQLVRGSAPTAGEAAAPAGRAEFSALQETARRVRPSDYVARADQQNQARIAAVKSFAGDDAAAAAAREARSRAAGPLYESGQKQTTWALQDLKDLFGRPSMKSALNRAETLAKEKDKLFSLKTTDGVMRPVTGEEAHTLKLAFDDMITHAKKSGIETAELDAIKATRGEYVKWMEGKFPDLKAARAVYKEKSGLVNQMAVGRTLEEKLVPPLREDAPQRAGVFAGAVRESASTLKKATGEPRFKELEDVLTARQLKTVQSVQDDLGRASRHEELARKGAGSANAATLGSANLDAQAGGRLPQFFNKWATVTNAILARMGGKVDKKLAEEMALEMLSPPGVAQSLATAQARAAKNAATLEALRDWQKRAIAGGVSSVVSEGE